VSEGRTPEGGFLSRWTRLKQEARSPRIETPAPAAPPEPAGPTPEEIEALVATLPKLEEIDAATDVRRFLESWVPAALRKAALARVWASDPKIANFVEMADYQWDFTVPGGAPGCGPLEPDFDTEAFVREIYGETKRAAERAGEVLREVGHARDPESHDEAVTGAETTPADVAPQSSLRLPGTPAPVADAEIPSIPNREMSAAPEGDGSSARNDAAPQQENDRDAAPLLAKKRRHGGALPD